MTFFCDNVAHTEFLIEPKQVVPARTRLFSQDLTGHLRPHQYPFYDLQASWLAYSGATVAGVKGIDILKFLSSRKSKWTRSATKKLLLFATAGGTGYGLGALLGTFVTPSRTQQGLIFENNAEAFVNFYYLGIFRAFSKIVDSPPMQLAFEFDIDTPQAEIDAMSLERKNFLQEITARFEGVLDRSGSIDASDFKAAFAHFFAAEAALRNKIYLPASPNMSDQQLVRAMTLYGQEFSREYQGLYHISIQKLRLVGIASLVVSAVICYIALVRYQMSRGRRAQLRRIREEHQAIAPHGTEKPIGKTCVPKKTAVIDGDTKLWQNLPTFSAEARLHITPIPHIQEKLTFAVGTRPSTKSRLAVIRNRSVIPHKQILFYRLSQLALVPRTST